MLLVGLNFLYGIVKDSSQIRTIFADSIPIYRTTTEGCLPIYRTEENKLRTRGEQ